MHKRIELADGEMQVISGIYSGLGGNLVATGPWGTTVNVSFTISPSDAIDNDTAVWVPVISKTLAPGEEVVTERIDPQLMALRVSAIGGPATIEVRV